LSEFTVEARKAMWGRGSRVDWFFTEAEDGEVRRRIARRYAAVESPIDINQRGFVRDLSQWSPAAAKFLAHQEGHPNGSRELTPGHWHVIHYLRVHYHPAVLSDHRGRPSLDRVCDDVGLTKRRFLELFPGGLKAALRVSGLPGPRRSANGSPLPEAAKARAGDWWARLSS
jgi:sulfur relay (sulfurtransferase) DsrC/TusE family protein